MKTTVRHLKGVIAEAMKRAKWNPQTKDELIALLLKNGFEEVDINGWSNQHLFKNEEYDISVYIDGGRYSLLSPGSDKKFRTPLTLAQYVQPMLVGGSFAHEGANLVCVSNNGLYTCEFNVDDGSTTVIDDNIVRTAENAPIFNGDLITIMQGPDGDKWVEHNGSLAQIVQRIRRQNFSTASDEQLTSRPKISQTMMIYVQNFMNSPVDGLSHEGFTDVDMSAVINTLKGCHAASGYKTHYNLDYTTDLNSTFAFIQHVKFDIDRSFKFDEFTNEFFAAAVDSFKYGHYGFPVKIKFNLSLKYPG